MRFSARPLWPRQHHGNASAGGISLVYDEERSMCWVSPAQGNAVIESSETDFSQVRTEGEDDTAEEYLETARGMSLDKLAP
jgi:hypothetical protein